MKPRHSGHASQSCSCASCFYKGTSEKPSLKHVLLEGGSKKDKLYYGKNIPMREQKLLNRLIRTRAVYDDIRNEIVSNSRASIGEVADLQSHRLSKSRSSALDAASRSSAILEIVSLVDRGAIQHNNLSECCSCCICRSASNLHEHEGGGHRHIQSRGSSRSSISSHSKYTDERDIRKHVQYKTKRIQSDPCTCILDSVRIKTKQPNRAPYKYHKGRGKHKNAYRNIKSRMSETINTSLANIKRTKTKMELGIRKSIERIKDSESKISMSVSENIRKFLDYAKVKYNRDLDTAELIDLFERTFDINLRDFMYNYDEKMQVKWFLDNWACDFECDPEECIPEECFEVKKRTLQTNKRGGHKKNELRNMNAMPISSFGNIANKHGSTQAKSERKATKTETRSQRTESRLIASGTVKPKRKLVKPSTSLQSKASSHTISEKSRGSRQIQKRRHKKLSTNKNFKTGFDLKRCFCTIKLKPKVIRSKTSQATPQTLQTHSSVTKTSQTSKFRSAPPDLALLPYECAPMVCIPGECDPIDCEKMIRKRNLKYRSVHSSVQYRTQRSQSSPTIKTRTDYSGETTKQSVSDQSTKTDKTDTSVNQSPAKRMKKDTLPRQAVRISSNFSFHIEFNKKLPDDEQHSAPRPQKRDTLKIVKNAKSPEKKLKSKSVYRPRARIIHKSSQISTSGKSEYTSTKRNLRRCFCTLKLAKTAYKPRSQTTSKGTLTSGISDFEQTTIYVDRATQKRTKKNLRFYECEPGVCVPNECNPYECLKIINARNMKRGAIGVGTKSRQTKSTYSITNEASTNSRTKEVQSALMTRKEQITQGQRVQGRNRTPTVHLSPRRQAVRVASSFSFSVKLSKDTSQSPTNNISQHSYQEAKVMSRPHTKVARDTHTKERGSQNQVQNKQKSTLAEAKKKNKAVLINTAMKRCFCTLKLQQRGKNNKPNKFANVITETTPVKETMHPKMVSKSTRTNRKPIKQKIQHLEPYECEPFYCVPGECDPHECLERIKMRANLKTKNFGDTTHKNKMRSVSSLTSKVSVKSRHAQIQSRTIKKKRTRSNYYKSTLPKNDSDQKKVVRDTLSRQSVRIGSNFSFYVEFYRDKFSEKDIQRALRHKMSEVKTSRVLKHAAESPIKVAVKERNSQSISTKISDKASGIRPLLKRCFCTLKLQKKQKHKRAPNTINSEAIQTTVMPVQVFYENMKLKTPTTKKISQSEYSKDYFEYSTLSALSSTTVQKSIQLNNSTIVSVVKDVVSSGLYLAQKYPFVKSSICAMNLQLQHNVKKEYKRESYEYESDLCDPIECQNQIMKSLMRKVSKSSSTENPTMSLSNVTANLQPETRSKKHQININLPKSKPRSQSEHKRRGFQYKTSPRPYKAVRVGSSFKFDIRFLKNISCKAIGKSDQKRRCVATTGTIATQQLKTKNMQYNSARNRHRKTQSVSTMHQKSSSTFKRKRCFCTLKLQKAGTHIKTTNFSKREECNKTTKMGPNNRIESEMKTSNIKLDPRRCEPNILVPSECDSYQCLERIKSSSNMRRRSKEIGTAIRTPKSLASCMNTTNNSSKEKYVQHGQKSPSIQPVKKCEPKRIRASRNNIDIPSGPALRLGSKYSFKVELLKENTPVTNSSDISDRLKQRPRVTGKSAQSINIVQSSEKAIQSCTNSRHQNSQAKILTRHRATKPISFLKRCFCTAKLPRNSCRTSNGTMESSEFSTSFREKCICVLKSLTTVKYPLQKKVANETLPSTTNTLRDIGLASQTDKIKEKQKNIMTNFKPYEYKLGFRVPGQCDPNACGEKFKTRTHFNKMSSTDGYDTKSVSTIIKSSQNSKSTAILKDRSPKVCSGYKKQRDSNKILEKVPQVAYAEKNAQRNCDPSECKKRAQLQSDAGRRQIKLLPHECEPGICIPGKCDPYECEKLIKKRLRACVRESTTSTSSTKRKDRAKSTITNARRKRYKERKIQSIDKPERNVKVKKELTGEKKVKKVPNIQSTKNHEQSDHSNKQVVRISSNFSFKIQFYKDKPVTHTQEFSHKPCSKMCQNDTKLNKTKGILSNHINVMHRQSQCDRQGTKSKANGVGPLLKRCFCTLKLQKVGNKQRHHENNHINIETKTKDCGITTKDIRTVRDETIVYKDMGTETRKMFPFLDPYECEPYTCVPGNCNPLKCYERIKQRNQRELGTGNTNPCQKSVSSLTNEKRSHLKKLQTSTERPVTRKSRNSQSSQRVITRTRTRPSRRQKRFDNSHENPINNRQSVRFGSSFQFDIEFSKDRSLSNLRDVAFDQASKGDTATLTPIKTTNRGSGATRPCYNKQQQVHVLKKKDKCSGMGPFIKRCFCTLALHKACQSKPSPELKTVSIDSAISNHQNKDKSTITRYTKIIEEPVMYLDPYECSPGVCIPGQCDPYECLERIKRRRIKRRRIQRQSRAVNTRQLYTKCSVGSLTLPIGQYSRSIGSQQKIPEIVEKPRFPLVGPNNWQRTTFGSNFSFDVEFYKKNVTPDNIPLCNTKCREKPLQVHEKSVRTNHYTKQQSQHTNTNIQNKMKCNEMQAKQVTKNKISATGNALKRCFCTAKLRSADKSIVEKQLTVGRVDNIKTTSPFKPTRYCVYQVKPSICRCLKIYNKNAATKANKNRFMSEVTQTKATAVRTKNRHNQTRRDNNNKYKKINTENTKYKNTYENDMETILPYTPRKFNKHVSKTALKSTKAQASANYDCCPDRTCDKEFCLVTKQKQTLLKSTPTMKGVLMKRFPMLSKSTTRDGDNLKKSKSERSPQTPHSDYKHGQEKYSPLQSGDAARNVMCPKCRVPLTNIKTDNANKMVKFSLLPEAEARERNRKPAPRNTTAFAKTGAIKQRFCNPLKYMSKRKECQIISQPSYQTTYQPTSQPSFQPKSKSTYQDNPTLVTVCGKDIKYQLDKCKAGGDAKRNKNNILTTVKISGDNLKYFIREDDGTNCFRCKDDKVRRLKTGKKKSVKFKDSRADSLNYQQKSKFLLNSKSQGIAIGKNTGKYEQENEQGSSNINRSALAMKKNFASTHKPLKITSSKGEICVCGSSLCNFITLLTLKATNLKNLRNKRSQIQPCICGSQVCKRELEMMIKGSKVSQESEESISKKKNKDKERKKKKREKEKAKKKKLKKERERKRRKPSCMCLDYLRKEAIKKVEMKRILKEMKERRLQYQKEDKIRRKRRMKKDKALLKQIKKYKNRDFHLLAASLCDIGKLGFTTISDVARSGYRTVSDPKNTGYFLKTMVKDPNRACAVCKGAVVDSGVGSTLRRIKMRSNAMRCVKSLKSKMEDYAFTHYLLHMGDKKPKARKIKPKIRKREQTDFQCSLFMATLRKKPFMFVYRRCPWFYPHCLSMLNVWRQFTDIVLFMLAILVWSPCIFAMEACRAVMCCFLCNG